MITPLRGPRARAAAALACGALVATGCGGGGDDRAPTARPGSVPTGGASMSAQPTSAGTLADQAALAKFRDQKLNWSSCGEGFQCGKVKVPVDYGAPDGETLNLAVTRLQTDNSKRVGSLLFNPGGPGASGVKYLQQSYMGITQPVRDNYDLVSFDPRGVGDSQPIDCVTDRQLEDFVSADVTMDDPADLAQWDRIARKFAAGCAQRTGALLAEVDTDSVARDLDILRAVLGDETLHYLGYSYGTFIGARYAELFPDKVGRLVLDGAIDPSLDAVALSLAQAEGFEVAWDAFAQACVKDKDCQLGDQRGEIDSRVRAMLNAADKNPLRSRSGRQVSESMATLGVVSALYSKQLWDFLRSALFNAYNGDGTSLLLLADRYLQRADDGSFPDNSNEAIYAVTCLDRPFEGTIADIENAVPRYREASPLFGEFIAWSSLLPCTYWPSRPDHGPGAVTAAGAAPIVVIGTTRDPATPYEWARALAGQLESGVFVSHDGDGHTVYGDGNRCIDRLVEDYLVNGEAPREGVECD